MLTFDPAPTDDTVDTLRYRALPVFDDAPTDPDATAIYDLRDNPPPRYAGRASVRLAARRRMIRATRQDIAGLRAAIAAGWDVGPELAHEQRHLALLLGQA